jgi:hypothetical protein
MFRPSENLEMQLKFCTFSLRSLLTFTLTRQCSYNLPGNQPKSPLVLPGITHEQILGGGGVTLHTHIPVATSLTKLTGPEFRWRSRESKRLLPLSSWVRFSLRTHVWTRVKSQSTLCRKSWVFFGCSSFLPQGKLTGWVRTNTVEIVISQLL